MTLWLLLALMTAAASMALLWPLGRACAPAAGEDDVAFYRAALADIARDADAGRIGAEEAAAARIEAARRLLRSEAEASAPARAGEAPGALRRRRLAAILALLAVPAVALPLYGTLGSPDLPD